MLYVLPANCVFLRVGLPGLEPGTSSLSEKHNALQEVSRVCKTPANKHIIRMILFLRFQFVCLGCCTVAAHGTLGRTRTCDLLIRSPSPSKTGRDIEGQVETKQRFYRESEFLKGQGETGKDTRLRSDCGQNTPGAEDAITSL